MICGIHKCGTKINIKTMKFIDKGNNTSLGVCNFHYEDYKAGKKYE